MKIELTHGESFYKVVPIARLSKTGEEGKALEVSGKLNIYKDGKLEYTTDLEKQDSNFIIDISEDDIMMFTPGDYRAEIEITHGKKKQKQSLDLSIAPYEQVDFFDSEEHVNKDKEMKIYFQEPIDVAIDSFFSDKDNVEKFIAPFIPIVEDGYTPRKGVDYDDGYTPIKGKDYFDGVDGETPKKGVDYFTDKEILEIKKALKKSILEEMPDHATKEEVNIKFEDILKKIKNLPKGGGGALFLRQLMDVNVGTPTAQQYGLTYSPSRSEFALTPITGGGGGAVESVTGLNTDNTDPANPIVQISVDGVTITGAGTPGSPLTAVTGGSGDVTGPASAVDDRIATFDGPTGKIIQDGGVKISDLATAAQGALADSALQSSDIGVTVQAHSSVLDNTTASFTTTDETKLDNITVTQAVNLDTMESDIAGKADKSGALTQFVGNNTHKVFYSDGSGDIQELALGADGTFLKSNGAAVAPSFATPAGSGDVSKVGTPVDNQVGVWTGDGTIEGTTGLTYDGSTLGITGNITVSGTVDGRDVATDGTKLDGIEAGAEVNNISDANANDLTDGGDTTLHIHDSRYYTESETDTLLNAKVTANGAITGATKTKITYDTKGLVTAGADATTADIADSSNRRYLTDAQQTIIAATTASFTTADETKLDNITVTQAVDLDQMEIDIAALANGMVYKGNWDASAGTFPGGGAAQTGWFYTVSVGGTVDSVVFNVDDRLVAITDNASTTTYTGNWSKLDATDAVTSVFGRTGNVVATNGDYTASNITNVPAGNIAATDVQTALNELDTEKVPYTGATTDLNLGTHDIVTDTARASTSAGLLVESANGTDVGLLGAGNTANITWYGNHNFDTATQDTIAGFTGAGKTLGSLATATYPSLTELSYIKGVTSGIQAQINAIPALTDGDKGDITVSSSGANWTIDNDAVTYAKMQNVVGNNVLLGNNSGAGGVVDELTASEVRTIINVEDGADVTDTANVTSAGALMDSEVTSLSGIKTLTVPDSTTISTYAKSFLDDTDEATFKATVNLEIGTDVQAYNAGLTKRDIVFGFDGAGSALTTSVAPVRVRIPAGMTVNGWDIVSTDETGALLTGSIVVDIQSSSTINGTYSSIASTEKPTLSSASSNSDNTLSSFSTSLTSGHYLMAKVDSVTTCEKVVVILKCTLS